mmetsp:Transcript_51514/g.111737  ORF Transcript_51514/g.111737 Transcript_51514/m.111737 type:complete len:108 (-) Transcript_51514:133-456(-)
MGLLRVASRLASSSARTSRSTVALAPPAARSFVTRSKPRLGHNLEDHFDFAEYVMRMHHPMGEYMIYGLMFSTFFITFGPLLHSNYYFTGRFLPKDQGNTKLCDDSW